MATSSDQDTDDSLHNVAPVKCTDTASDPLFKLDSPVRDETVVATEINYTNEGGLDDDDDSGSASVHTEDLIETEDSEDSDDEVTTAIGANDEIPIDIPEHSSTQDAKPKQGTWPTLEILPGGVIKRVNIENESQDGKKDAMIDTEMYACAQCPQKFQFLYLLVKHVRWHEEEKQTEKGADLNNLNDLEKSLINIKRTRFKIEKKYRRQKTAVMERIATSLGQLDVMNEESLFSFL